MTRTVWLTSLLLVTSCVRAGFESAGDGNNLPGLDRGAALVDGIGPLLDSGGRDQGAPDQKAADLPTADGTPAGGSHDCADPVLVDMTQAPVVLHLDFSSAGCFYSGSSFCSCYTSRQIVLRVVNSQGQKVHVACSGSTGYDKVYIDSELSSTQCPPQNPLLSTLACGMGATVSHGYGEYLIACRRNTDPQTATLTVTFD